MLDNFLSINCQTLELPAFEAQAMAEAASPIEFLRDKGTDDDLGTSIGHRVHLE
ncbi:hypothetical protein [Vulcaniibacterium tengchongense]|uniref:hypothetical protein n=1 Tax=Vulcaniibacterium tengchongense TaxID=1273429 RepID=UPI0013156E8F|nr:hypothetical protein [Vulcaniibacterium tengchongense]